MAELRDLHIEVPGRPRTARAGEAAGRDEARQRRAPQTLRIPARLLEARFSRSGGPGGQNVNKVATKVDLRLDLDGARECIGDAAVARIRTALAARLDAEGRLQVVSSEHRSQARNLEAAHRRLETWIAEALAPRRPRRPTRPSRGARERRLAEKQQRGERKRERSRDPHED